MPVGPFPSSFYMNPTSGTYSCTVASSVGNTLYKNWQFPLNNIQWSRDVVTVALKPPPAAGALDTPHKKWAWFVFKMWLHSLPMKLFTLKLPFLTHMI